MKELTDEHFYMFLEEGKIYLQHYHNSNMPNFFKDIKWFWGKDTAFMKRGEVKKWEAANKRYKSVKDWVMYCGGRNSGLWIPNWAQLQNNNNNNKTGGEVNENQRRNIKKTRIANRIQKHIYLGFYLKSNGGVCATS